MAVDVLQQLRDIHLPEPPGLWPPAPGWWLLALLLLAALIWLGARMLAAARVRRPIRRARSLYDDIYRRHQGGEISTRAYLDESNELIKRLLIHGLGDDQARRANGEAWLALLDRHADEPAFTSGPGSALGDARFRPDVTADTAAVHQAISRLLARIQPRDKGGAW
ncbi:MAG: DUF4381 domain-containing protein [Pseudomonadales bacterium]